MLFNTERIHENIADVTTPYSVKWLCGSRGCRHTSGRKTYYVNQGKSRVVDCLHYAATKEKLSLEYDDTLPENVYKYNLINTETTAVAWVEISKFNSRQTSVEFYYAPHAPDIHRSVTAIAERCT